MIDGPDTEAWVEAVNDQPGDQTAWYFANDNMEQQRMGAAYPDNGLSWDWNAATLGVSRLIDTATKAYVNVKGSQAATYAGQNGLTYVSPTGSIQRPPAQQGSLLPIVLLGALAAFLA